MWLKRLFGAILVMVGTGCVSTSDFNAYKQAVLEDGDAVEAWIATAHEVVKWVSANGGTFCPDCDPPDPPPDPPPDGDWGTQ
jgi:hypothetical protein